MKKILLPLVLLLLIVNTLAVSATIESKTETTGRLTVFEGVVTDENGNGIENAKVIVRCTHDYDGTEETKRIRTTKTDDEGHFLTFTLNLNPNKQCRVDDTAFIRVKHDGIKYDSEVEDVVRETFEHNGNEYGYGYAAFSVGVPEFSTATMAIAVLGVTLGIVALRRKQ